jgi:hypothetical protein
MSDPSNNLIAVIIALLLGGGTDAPGVKPMPNPAVTATAAATCELAIRNENGRQSFVATVSTTAERVSGRYVLTLNGTGANKVSVRDERSLTLSPGKTAVLSKLELNSGTRLSGELVLRTDNGAVICNDHL